MMLIEETTVPQAVLPVPGLRSHLRLGSGFAEDSLQDGLLEGFLRAALAAIEARTGKALIAREFTWTVERWNDAGQGLPIAPVSAISQLSMVGRDGMPTVIEPAKYRLVQDAVRPVLAPMGSCLPTIPFGGHAELKLTAGMSPDWGALPADLAHAVMLLAAHYYEYRDETSLGRGCMPFGVTSLIERYRPLRIGLGADQ